MRHEGTSSWFSTSLIPILQRARFLTKNSGQSRCGRNKNYSVHIASDELPFQGLEEMRERKAEMSNASWIVIRPSRLVCLPLGPQPQSLEGFSTGSTMVNVSLANDHRISLIGYHRDGHCILHGAWLQRPVNVTCVHPSRPQHTIPAHPACDVET